MKNKPGFVLVLTLMIIALSTLIVSRMVYIGVPTTFLDQTVIYREQAKVLALSGIQGALSVLDAPVKPEPTFKNWLQRILPGMNRWHTLTFTQEQDELDASLSFCIMSEYGKFNLNNLFDFETHKWRTFGKDNAETIVKNICERIEKKTGNRGLFKELTTFLEKQKKPLEDLTELLKREDNKPLLPAWVETFGTKLYYEPPMHKNGPEEPSNTLYLTDLFTLWTSSHTVEPWLLSDSVCALYGLARAAQSTRAQRKEQVKEWLKNFTERRNWPQDWAKQMGLMYKTGSPESSGPTGSATTQPSLPFALFAPSVSPRLFSVIAQASVNGITQRVWAFIENTPENNNTFNIKRIMWL